MATIQPSLPTLYDHAKRLDPDGKIANIVELLTEENEMLQDAVFLEGNLTTGHQTTVRTGLPETTWRSLNYGVQPSKSTTAQITDTCGLLESYATVDEALVELNGNTAAFRLSEERSFREAMSQEMARTLIYGNEGITPAAFTGFAPRFNNLNAGNAENIVDAGGTGAENTSIWMVTWGDQTAHGIFPKGTKAGLDVDDLGLGMVRAPTEGGGEGDMKAYRTHYKWRAGLTVRDWRYVVRIGNIDTQKLNDVSYTKTLLNMLITATETRPSSSYGRTVFYCNKKVRTALRFAILDKIANNLTWETVAGKRVMMFDEIPIRRADAILNTEARIVAS